MADLAGEYQLGPDTGRVVIKTGRAGIAARAGHDLTIEVTRWSARVVVPAEDAGGIAAAAFSSSRIIPSGAGGVLQSGLGITPCTGFFGALKLRDEVVAEFELELTPAAPGIPAP